MQSRDPLSLRPDENDEQTEETIKPTFRTISREPTQEEIDEHNIDHSKFRVWCPHCVSGRAVAYPHLTGQKKTRDIPVISIDYAFMNDDKDKKEEQEKGMPIIVIKDSESKTQLARVVPKKGVDPYAVDRIKRDIDQFGYKTIILKSDQENSIKALKQAIKDSSSVELRMEESPVGEHQSNGSIENAIRDIKSQFRTLKGALDTRYQNKYSGEHPSIPWMFKHSADIINRTRISTDGKTAFRRLRGNNVSHKVAEFGENVW